MDSKEIERYKMKVEAVLKIIEQEKQDADNPFLYTRIQQKFKKTEQSKSSANRFLVYKRILQPAFAAMLITVGISIGIKITDTFIGETDAIAGNQQTVENYFNELVYENLELELLNN